MLEQRVLELRVDTNAVVDNVEATDSLSLLRCARADLLVVWLKPTMSRLSMK